MQKRKFIILIIVLIIISFFSFSFFLSQKQEKKGTLSSKPLSFIANFNPFKKSENSFIEKIEDIIDLNGNEEETEETSTESLTQVSSLPVAGFGLFLKERFKEVPEVIPTPAVVEETEITETHQTTEIKKIKEEKPTPPPTESVVAVRYADRALGNIYQTFADQIDERKLTSTVIPKIYEAYFGNKGEAVILRYLKNDEKTIETFISELPKDVLGADSSENMDLKGSFLPENITDLSVSQDKTKIFYLFNSGNYSVGISAQALGEKKNQVFSSPFTEWLSVYPNNEIITLNTKPSFNVPGYLYKIDINKKELTKVIGDINGLTSLTSPNGKLVLFANNDLELNIYNIETTDFYPVSALTLPEKCVWNNSSTYIYCAVPEYVSSGLFPDSWYMGEISFIDDIWKINAENGEAQRISDLNLNSQKKEIDGIKLAVDENEDYLFFINKKDSILWKLNLK